MAAAIRALRRLAAPSSSVLAPRAFPQALRRRLHPSVHARCGLFSGFVSLTPPPYCSARGGGSVGGLASGLRAYASQLQVPSLLPVRHHGSTSAKQLNSLEQFRDEAAMQFALEKLRNIDKSLTQLKRIMWLKVALLGLFLHAFYSLFFLLNLKVAALGEKVAELESRRIFERKIVQRSDLC